MYNIKKERDYMIWNILTFVLAIITFVFYSLYKTIKKFLIKKSFDAVSEVYRMYLSATSTDNSFLKISAIFADQKLFFCSFSNTILDLTKKNDELNPFSFFDYSLWEKQWFFSIVYFYRFWKTVKNKMFKILNILNNYYYSAKIGNLGLIKYRNKNKNPIKDFIIAFCPNFFIKLFRQYQGFLPYKENKFNLVEEYNEVKNFKKRFYKELKTNTFSVCIEFDTSSNNEMHCEHRYIINFKGNIISNVLCFFERQGSEKNINKEYICDNSIKIKNEINWIEESFNLNLTKKREMIDKINNKNF